MTGGGVPELKPAVSLRAADGHNERRHGDRRRFRRFGGERRRGDRRKQTLRTLLLAAAAVSATPSSVKTQSIQDEVLQSLQPTVSVSMNSFVPLKPEEAYEDLIQEAAQIHNLNPALIRAVMATESSFNASAVSPVGALGLMQLMPEVAKELGVVDPLDPRENIMGGAKYLRQLMTAHRGNVALTLASYNAGPGNVKRYKGIPPFKETRNYVKRITNLMEATD
jgi:soluble lytic murein transglycosylase-like protein